MRSRPFPLSGLLVVSALAGAGLLSSGACAGGDPQSSGSSTSSGGGTVSSSSNANVSSGNGNGSSGGGGSGTQSSSNRTSSSSRAASSGGAIGGSSGFMIPDGGFQFEGDAGWSPYTGDPEDGVVCDAELCNTDAGSPICCIDVFSGATTCQMSACTGIALAVRCDGPEDCTTADQVCCLGSQGGTCQAAATCVSPDGGSQLSQKYRACNTSADCQQGYGCCYSTTLEEFFSALDFGSCIAGCNVQ